MPKLNERPSASTDLKDHSRYLERKDHTARGPKQLGLHIERRRGARSDKIINLQTQRAERIASVRQCCGEDSDNVNKRLNHRAAMSLRNCSGGTEAE